VEFQEKNSGVPRGGWENARKCSGVPRERFSDCIIFAPFYKTFFF